MVTRVITTGLTGQTIPREKHDQTVDEPGSTINRDITRGGLEFDMLVIHCPREDTRVLVNLSRIRALRNSEDGIELDVECYCGQLVTIYTGRKRLAARPTHEQVRREAAAS